MYPSWLTHLTRTVFPGGYLPSLNLLISSMTSGSDGRLTTDHVSNIGPHYARTLREWKIRFERNFEEVIAPALTDLYGLGEEERGVFRRKWMCKWLVIFEFSFSLPGLF